eukprot:8637736-Alexandrium_andersonii.AAC.1
MLGPAGAKLVLWAARHLRAPEGLVLRCKAANCSPGPFAAVPCRTRPLGAQRVQLGPKDLVLCSEEEVGSVVMRR